MYDNGHTMCLDLVNTLSFYQGYMACMQYVIVLLFSRVLLPLDKLIICTFHFVLLVNVRRRTHDHHHSPSLSKIYITGLFHYAFQF